MFELNVYVSFQWPVSVEAARNRGQSLSEPKSRVTTSHARRDPYGSCNGESSVCLSVWVLICSRCMSGANCERESVTYSDGILMHPEKGNLHVERKSFPGVKRPSHEIHHSHVVPKMRMQWFVPRSHGEEFKYRAKFTTAAADLLTSKDWRSEISHIRESVLSRVNLEGGISAGAWPSIMSDSCKSCLGWCAPLSNFWVPLSK